MSNDPFRRPGLLGGPDRRAETPLSEDEQQKVRGRLQRLVGDPLRRDLQDDEFTGFTRRQYKHVFRGEGERDASGRMIMTPPARADLETFRPSVKRRELELSGSVGEGARNRMRDVVGVKKGLSNTGLFEFDFDNERSTDANERFKDAVKSFQRIKGLEPDGLLNPKGKTVTALDATLFPQGGGGGRTVRPGEGPDLRPKVPASAKGESTGAVVPASAKSSTGGAAAGRAEQARDGRGAQPRAEAAELKVERAIPFEKRTELRLRKAIFDEEDVRLAKAAARFVKAKDPEAISSATSDITISLSSIGSKVRAIADLLEEPGLARSVDSLDRKTDEALEALDQDRRPNMDGLIRQWNKTRLLLKMVLLGPET